MRHLFAGGRTIQKNINSIVYDLFILLYLLIFVPLLKVSAISRLLISVGAMVEMDGRFMSCCRASWRHRCCAVPRAADCSSNKSRAL